MNANKPQDRIAQTVADLPNVVNFFIRGRASAVSERACGNGSMAGGFCIDAKITDVSPFIFYCIELIGIELSDCCVRSIAPKIVTYAESIRTIPQMIMPIRVIIIM